MSEWYTEKLYPDWQTRYRITKELARKKTAFQRMRVLESPVCGRMLVLDDITQTTEFDEFVYHEMMTHVAMVGHGRCRNALIIGGGDGGILREVLAHPVERAVQVEIDSEVVAFSKKHLPGISRGAYDDPRTELLIGDGADYVKHCEDRFDVVIVDSPDPVGPAKVLFETPFYRDVVRVLRRGGLMVRQAGVPHLQPDELQYTMKRMRKVFPATALAVAPVPTYVGGFFTFAFGATASTPLRRSRRFAAERIHALGLKTRYYNEEIHTACFALPNHIKELLK